MAHIFDIMATVYRQIDEFAKTRSNSSPNVPDFLMVECNRAIDTIPGIRIDETQPITIERSIRSHAGDPETLVYTAIASNIKKPIIDTFSVVTDGKDRKGKDVTVCDTAIGVVLPKTMFNEDTDIKDVATLLRKTYFGILDTDPNMHYTASPAIVRLSKSNKIRIPTYDVEMVICAICCIYVSLGSWFTGNNGSVGTSYATDAFTDKEIPADMKEKIGAIMTKHCASIRALKDSIGTGKLLKIFFM